MAPPTAKTAKKPAAAAAQKTEAATPKTNTKKPVKAGGKGLILLQCQK